MEWSCVTAIKLKKKNKYEYPKKASDALQSCKLLLYDSLLTSRVSSLRQSDALQSCKLLLYDSLLTSRVSSLRQSDALQSCKLLLYDSLLTSRVSSLRQQSDQQPTGRVSVGGQPLPTGESHMDFSRELEECGSFFWYILYLSPRW